MMKNMLICVALLMVPAIVSSLEMGPSSSFGRSRNWDEHMIENVMEFLKGKTESLMENFGPYLSQPARDNLEVFFYLAEELQPDPQIQPICVACKAFVRSLMELVQNPWEEVRNRTIELCYDLFQFGDTDVDTLCPGIVDDQGPPLYYVVEKLKNVGEPSAESMCRNLGNACYPDPVQGSTKQNKKKKSPLKKHRKNTTPKRSAQKAYDPYPGAYKIVHLTDIHLEPQYEEGAPTSCGLPSCCKADNLDQGGEAGKWASRGCQTSPDLLDVIFDQILTLDPDCIIYTGDTPPSTMWNESFSSQLDKTRQLVDTLARKLPGVPVYPNMGNHEYFPTNTFYLEMNETKDMLAGFADLWKPVANFSTDQVTSMASDGIYTMSSVVPGVRILCINSDYWYGFNWYNVLIEQDQDDLDRMYTFIENALELARTDAEKVIILAHHPGGIILQTRRFADIVVNYGDVILFQASGHTHSENFELYIDPDDGEAKAVLFVQRAVVPGGMNSYARVFYVEEKELLDMDTFKMEIDGVADDVEPEFKLVYSVMEAYGLADMSPESFQDFVDRMSKNETEFYKYYEYHSGGTCNANCQEDHICEITNIHVDEEQDCKRNGLPTEAPPSNDTTTSSDLSTCAPVTCPPCATEGDTSGGYTLMPFVVGFVLTAIAALVV